MLEIKNLSKAYGEKTVLNNVSFSVGSGSICALLGLNGAGKSTLMKILCRLVIVGEGNASIDGVNLLSQKEINTSVGFMIESPAFYRELTGEQNLTALSLLFDGITNARIKEVLACVGLTNQAMVKVKNYSLGMRQRLYFAYAILNNPKLLILDEPFNGIDPVTINLFKLLLTKLSHEGCTILISGHIISELQSVCNQAIILDKGAVIYQSDILDGKNLTNIFLSLVSGGGSAQ